MKSDTPPNRRAVWLLLAAPALLAIPAHGQEVTAPPPVTQTAPAAAASEPAPAPQTTAPVAAVPETGTSRTTIAPGAEDVVDDARIAAQREAPSRPATRTVRAATVRQAAPERAVATPAARPAPVAAAPVATPSAPATQPSTAPAEAAVAPAPVEPATTTTERTTTETSASSFALWPLLLVAGLILLGAVGYRIWGRRRDREETVYYDDDAQVDTAYVEAPVAEERVVPLSAPLVAAAPLVSPTVKPETRAIPVAQVEEATIADAGADDVAALTDGEAPVTDRPWLEFAMRPVRIGSSDDEAVVEIELTVANAGTVPAHDVRVSAFMLTDVRGSDVEAMLIDRQADAAVDPVDIAPGAGTRIDATLATPRSDVGAAHFRPVVVADARYRLPDGSEGRTSASFMVGVTQGDGIAPVELDEGGMRDDVEARLHGEPLHA